MKPESVDPGSWLKSVRTAVISCLDCYESSNWSSGIHPIPSPCVFHLTASGPFNTLSQIIIFYREKILHWLPLLLRIEARVFTKAYKALCDLTTHSLFNSNSYHSPASLTQLQPHWPTCCSSNTLKMLLPQGLCTCSSLCQDFSSLRYLYSSFSYFILCRCNLLREALPLSKRSPCYSLPPSLYFSLCVCISVYF